MLLRVPFVANTIESQGRVAWPRQRESCCVAFAQDSMLFLGASVAGDPAGDRRGFHSFLDGETLL